MAGYNNIVGRGGALQITPVKYGAITPGKAAPKPRVRGGSSTEREGMAPNKEGNAAANARLGALEAQMLDNAIRREQLGALRDTRQANADARQNNLIQQARGGAPWQIEERTARAAEDELNQKRQLAEQMKAASQLAYQIDSTEPDNMGNIKLKPDAIQLLHHVVPTFQAQFDDKGKLKPVVARIAGSGEPGSREQVLEFYATGADDKLTPITTPDGAPVRPNLNALAVLADYAREDQRRRNFLPTQSRKGDGGDTYKNRLAALKLDVQDLAAQRDGAYERVIEARMMDPEGQDPATLDTIRRYEALSTQFSRARDIYGRMAQQADYGVRMGAIGQPSAFAASRRGSGLDLGQAEDTASQPTSGGAGSLPPRPGFAGPAADSSAALAPEKGVTRKVNLTTVGGVEPTPERLISATKDGSLDLWRQHGFDVESWMDDATQGATAQQRRIIERFRERFREGQ